MRTGASERPGCWGTESSREKPVRETRAGHMSTRQRGSRVGAGQGLSIRAWWGLWWGRVAGWGLFSLSPFASERLLRWVGPGGGPVGTPTARVPWRNKRCCRHSVLVSGSTSDVAGQFGKCCQGRKVDSEALWGWAAWLPLPLGGKPPGGSVPHCLRLSRPCVWLWKRSLAKMASEWSGGGPCSSTRKLSLRGLWAGRDRRTEAPGLVWRSQAAAASATPEPLGLSLNPNSQSLAWLCHVGPGLRPEPVSPPHFPRALGNHLREGKA